MNCSRTLMAALVAGAMALSLQGCGGGSNADVVVSKPGVALYTSAAAAMAMEVGATAVYKVGGGGAGSTFTSYTATSSSADVLSASITGGDLVLKALKAGTATVVVKDSAGATVEIKVSIGNTSGLAIQAPASVTLVAGSADTYHITGGVAPYTVVSSNLAVAKGSIVNGNTVSVNAFAVGGAQISVYDANGATSSITTAVTAGSTPAALFATAPSYLSLSLNGVVPSYQIGGGTGPYVVNSTAPDVILVATTGNSFTIAGKSTGFGAVFIKDATGNSVQISVSVVNGKVDVPFYTTAPTSIVTKSGSTTSYAVAGGTAPYSISSSDLSVATVTMVGTNYSVTSVAPGSSNVVIKDAVGAVTTLSVTVPDPAAGQIVVALHSSAPGSIILPNLSTSTFSVAGGKAPYSVVSSNPSVATASLTGTSLSVTGVHSGTTNVVVKDAAGDNVNIAVTVPSTSNGQDVTPIFTTAPPSVVIKNGVSSTYTISGGTAPYTVTSSDVTVVSTSISGTAFTLLGTGVGTANVVVLDAAGAVVNIAVTTK